MDEWPSAVRGWGGDLELGVSGEEELGRVSMGNRGRAKIACEE